MKKFILSVLCAFMGFAAIAQYNVGEVVEIDGVKTIVFHSDDEHTYAISLWAKDKDVRKKFKDELDEGKYLPYTDIKHMEAVFDDLSKMGRNNQDVVESYCEKNNVDINVAFPLYAWVDKLGGDWFLPGDKELELYAQFTGAGFGRENYKGNKEAQRRFMKIQKTLPKDMSLPMVIRGSSVSKNGSNYNNNCIYYITGGGGGTFDFGSAIWWEYDTTVKNEIIKIILTLPHFFPVAVVEL